MLAPRESAFDPENPDNSLGPTSPIDDDDVYVDTVRQVPIFQFEAVELLNYRTVTSLPELMTF